MTQWPASPSPGQLDRAAATKLEAIVVYSTRGRVAVRAGLYEKAIANRQLTLRRLVGENIQLITEQVTLLVEAIKGGAQVAAQLAASALSSINLSGQIGDHVSYGVGYNVSNSSSASVSSANSTSKSTSDSTATTTSDSTITSTGNNTNTNYNFTP